MKRLIWVIGSFFVRTFVFLTVGLFILVPFEISFCLLNNLQLTEGLRRIFRYFYYDEKPRVEL